LLNTADDGDRKPDTCRVIMGFLFYYIEMLLCNVSFNMLLFKSVSDEIMKSTMIFQVCCLYFKVLNSR